MQQDDIRIWCEQAAQLDRPGRDRRKINRDQQPPIGCIGRLLDDQYGMPDGFSQQARSGRAEDQVPQVILPAHTKDQQIRIDGIGTGCLLYTSRCV